MIPPILVASGIAVIFGAAGAWTVQGWRYESRISDILRTHTQAAIAAQSTHIQALEQAREQTAKYQQDAHQAAADAASRVAAADRDLHRNRTELDRLRDAIRTRPATACTVPDTPTPASPSPVDAAGDILAECAAALADMARAADGHASDAVMCRSSWPALR